MVKPAIVKASTVSKAGSCTGSQIILVQRLDLAGSQAGISHVDGVYLQAKPESQANSRTESDKQSLKAAHLNCGIVLMRNDIVLRTISSMIRIAV
jgi:hypothetical protein